MTIDRTLTRRMLLGSAVDTLALPFLVSAGMQDGDGVRPASLGPSIPPELLAPSGNWPVAQGNLAATRSAVGSSIDASNIGQLRVRWEFEVEASTGYGGMTATPIVIDDLVYLQDMLSNVFALDRASGTVRWRKQVDIPTIGPNGVAVGYGLLFATTGDTAEVFALDAKSGTERWRVRLSNNPGEGIDMAPAVYDSTVFVSTVAGNTRRFNRAGTRGILYALDASTGATLWQFDTTNNLWGNPRINSGGGLWYPPSFDDSGGIYFGTGNAAPWPGTETYPNGTSRPGPNDYASSMVAMDRNSGAIRWHYNASPHDLFDHDFQNSPLLVDIPNGDGVRNLAIGSGKTGTVVAIDRDTGQIVWKTNVGRHQGDDASHLPNHPVEIYPGAWGGVLTPVAARGDRIFVPVVNQATNYYATDFDKMSMFNFYDATGLLVALNTSTGELVWQTELSSPIVGGATIVNNLVVTAGMDGLIRSLSADSGEILSLWPAEAGINASPAVAGDLLVVPAAGPRVASADAPTSSGQGNYTVVLGLGIVGDN